MLPRCVPSGEKTLMPFERTPSVFAFASAAATITVAKAATAIFPIIAVSPALSHQPSAVSFVPPKKPRVDCRPLIAGYYRLIAILSCFMPLSAFMPLLRASPDAVTIGLAKDASPSNTSA